jgi:predicted RNA methylase
MHTTEEDFPGSESIDSRDTGETSDDHSSSMTATYSPEDNKLRLYSVARLDKETYERVKAEGFRWAPQQKLFVAPMWTPSRADLLIELCGEIGDEDTSLVDRAEERAERFEDYSEKRADDAEAARSAVDRITSGIPLGQPILVGHHSERHARKDAERIESGMRKAVKMWETSKYWTDRAAGAISHAKYKERPDVRHRRIKGLASDKRKQEKRIKDAETFNRLWSKEGLTREQAQCIANHDHIRVYTPSDPYGETLWGLLDKGQIAPAEAAERAKRAHDGTIAHARRWLAHIENRLAYERAMLGEAGGIVADKFAIEVGGKVLCSGWRRNHGYLVVLRVNRVGGAIASVRVNGEGVVSVEDIEDYRAPEAGDVEKVKAATKLAPIVNYPGEGFRHMTKEEFDRRKKHSDTCFIKRLNPTAEHGAHRLRHAPKEGGPYYDVVGVYLTDQKRVDPPAAPGGSKPVLPAADPPPVRKRAAPRPAPERTAFDDLKDQLKQGVKVVSAPQLFPTPPALAARIVELARIDARHSVLEPSAGTGNILREIMKARPRDVVAIEINASLAEALAKEFPDVNVRCHDFMGPTMYGRFDRIVMNPPFTNGQDVDHVTQAFEWLDDGGELVAVMSAGVRFRSDRKTHAFRLLVAEHGEIQDLPDDTFKDQGTGVRTVLVTLQK